MNRNEWRDVLLMTNRDSQSDPVEPLWGQSKLTDGNMSFARGDISETVKNRRRFLNSQGLELENLVAAGLVHGANCEVADKYHRGRGAFALEEAIPGADALVTTETGLILTVTTADCLPVFIWSDDGMVVGIAHAGWKGLAGRVVENLIKTARRVHNIPLNRFYLKAGAGIGPCCYVVDKERLKKYIGYPMCEIHWREDETAHLNLNAIVKVQARRQGIPEENVGVTEECTCCGDNYPSYRREGENLKPDLAFIVKR